MQEPRRHQARWMAKSATCARAPSHSVRSCTITSRPFARTPPACARGKDCSSRFPARVARCVRVAAAAAWPSAPPTSPITCSPTCRCDSAGAPIARLWRDGVEWVLSLPYRLRYHLAWDHDLCRAVAGVALRAGLGWLRRRARVAHPRGPGADTDGVGSEKGPYVASAPR